MTKQRAVSPASTLHTPPLSSPLYEETSGGADNDDSPVFLCAAPIAKRRSPSVKAEGGDGEQQRQIYSMLGQPVPAPVLPVSHDDLNIDDLRPTPNDDNDMLHDKLQEALSRLGSMAEELKRARTVAAHHVLQFQLLAYDAAEQTKRHTVQSELTQKEIDALSKRPAPAPAAAQPAPMSIASVCEVSTSAPANASQPPLAGFAGLEPPFMEEAPSTRTQTYRGRYLKTKKRLRAAKQLLTEKDDAIRRLRSRVPTMHRRGVGDQASQCSNGSQTSGLDALGLLASQVLERARTPEEGEVEDVDLSALTPHKQTPSLSLSASKALLSPAQFTSKRTRSSAALDEETESEHEEDEKTRELLTGPVWRDGTLDSAEPQGCQTPKRRRRMPPGQFIWVEVSPKAPPMGSVGYTSSRAILMASRQREE
ncbi:hypothetical protein SAICODRAFT_18488 [Saitoella complicata NRRL Y-17804]|uniref:Uncharacterized protein n=1 Tax=Saitoella complicata (strain BCRC 22490 / CBS 7301 / JCM 7358 / NBRC 10748 / NRRL Y-17804) TaxID=698492 RepID=A0A0E9NAH5_SAICN|nr:uncharacterized protein SAICODRAFT_18488 [Saitoella complicata NRRL Y-17804]ODQ53924.1 hypothetical protein SAICODRAFT_18488 [Saitoella complicata NRRL Y-17804]GAO46862.1 hypothetical protein G7K_1080-t1 [Saitoella complicata NRRL Y-17804]